MKVYTVVQSAYIVQAVNLMYLGYAVNLNELRESKMKDNIYPYPCTECERKDSCYIMCNAYKRWFKEEWRIVTAPFREIANDRYLRKEGLKK